MVAKVIAVNSEDEIRNYIYPPSWGTQGGEVRVREVGRVPEFFRDVSDFWKDLDGYSYAVLGFFFTIPAHDPTPPGVVCGIGTVLDTTTIPPQCLPTDSLPPEVVCGVGTVLDTTTIPPQCVPVPPEPCPEVPVLDVEITVAEGADLSVFEARRKTEG